MDVVLKARSTSHDPAVSGPTPGLRVIAVLLVAGAAANCSNAPQKLADGSKIDPKYGVSASPRLFGENDPIPKGGGRELVGRPYVIAGQSYTPTENPKGYVREGLASWYGTAFHGRLTANGEVFDRYSVAAAHPTLPLPSYARVTNQANGHSMIVRVNDRGPYHAGRLMDVSQQVAEALDFRRVGTARVKVEYLGKASTRGSDDTKLMATLRTDGRPARHRQEPEIMLAEAVPKAPEAVRVPANPRQERVRLASADGEVVQTAAPRTAAALPKGPRLVAPPGTTAIPLPLKPPPLAIVAAPLPPGRPGAAAVPARPLTMRHATARMM